VYPKDEGEQYTHTHTHARKYSDTKRTMDARDVVGDGKGGSRERWLDGQRSRWWLCVNLGFFYGCTEYPAQDLYLMLTVLSTETPSTRTLGPSPLRRAKCQGPRSMPHGPQAAQVPCDSSRVPNTSLSILVSAVPQSMVHGPLSGDGRKGGPESLALGVWDS
jgi:hypothetical protein